MIIAVIIYVSLDIALTIVGEIGTISVHSSSVGTLVLNTRFPLDLKGKNMRPNRLKITPKNSAHLACFDYHPRRAQAKVNTIKNFYFRVADRYKVTEHISKASTRNPNIATGNHP